jgi:2-dehydro-3-deoxyphosphogluconate aldolase/(4S)-4-hydroxy-2-oxoglutarate aldolase
MDASKLLQEARVVPVVVIEDSKLAVRLAETLLEAGLSTIEITLRTKVALEAIEKIASSTPDLIIGAGSVRSAQQFRQVRNAGAKFAVSPGFSESLLDTAAEHEMPFIPGAATASEIIRLQERGYSLIKFFPAELAGGVPMLKALGAPLPEARFFPTGGITPESAKDYLALPNVSCIGGSWISSQALLDKQDFASISKLARDAVRLTT